MIQHVAEWVCKCTYCQSVVDMSVKMSMADGNYLLQFIHHGCTTQTADQEPPEVTYSAKTLSLLRNQVLPRQGYTVITEK